MEAYNLKNLKVLIVDDVDSITIAMRMIINKLKLGNFQISLLTAKSYQECLTVFKKEFESDFPIDLVIMDLNLGGGSQTIFHHEGEFLLQELKKINPKLKSIVYSQYDEPMTIKKVLLSTGANSYIVKGPQSMVDVKRAIIEIFVYNNSYYSEGIYFRDKTPVNLGEDHKTIIHLMKKGYSVAGISKILADDPDFDGASPRSIQRKIKVIREILKIDKKEDLIPALKEMGIIND